MKLHSLSLYNSARKLMLIYHPADRAERWVNLDGWLPTQTVYPPASSHSSK